MDDVHRIARWNEAFAERKMDEILSLYTDNSMLVQPDRAL